MHATLGAVAAPTAGLHFDAQLLDGLRRRGVELAFLTLHVGAGTFQPVRVRNIAAHRMHSEWYDIPATTATAVRRARAHSTSVIAVGTTTLRALEAAERAGERVAGCGETDLFITPGYRFRVVDRLITNFHLPKSTLLMLVSAFGGLCQCAKPIGTLSASATASSVTATRCSSTGPEILRSSASRIEPTRDRSPLDEPRRGAFLIPLATVKSVTSAHGKKRKEK